MLPASYPEVKYLATHINIKPCLSALYIPTASAAVPILATLNNARHTKSVSATLFYNENVAARLALMRAPLTYL